MDEPMLRVWMQDSVPPRRTTGERPGRWVAEDAWPSADRAGTAGAGAGAAATRGRGEAPSAGDPPPLATAASPPAAGAPTAQRRTSPATSARTTAGRWSSTPSRSTRRLEILGAPVVALEVAADRPVAPGGGAAVRRGAGRQPRCGSPTGCSTSPTGTATRARSRWSRAGATGSRSSSTTSPTRFRAGHRVRLALSTTLLADRLAGARAGHAHGADRRQRARAAGAAAATGGRRRCRPFSPPEAAPPQEKTVLRPGSVTTGWERDVATGDDRLAHRRGRGAPADRRARPRARRGAARPVPDRRGGPGLGGGEQGHEPRGAAGAAGGCGPRPARSCARPRPSSGSRPASRPTRASGWW